MGSLSDPLPNIPFIDFSEELNPQTDPWHRTAKLVKLALEEYGCFVARYDKVSLDLHRAIFRELEGLFDLPNDVKARNIYDKPYHGYGGNHPLVPLLEGTGIDNAMSRDATQRFTSLMWPKGNEPFCDAAHSFAKQVSELEQVVTRMVFESYGVHDYYDSHVGATNYLLRLMKYRSPELNEMDVGCDVHTDKSFLTVLHQNEVNGLEIKTKGGEWIGFKPSPSSSSFLVMAGDAMLAWSNGRIHSALHRVVMNRDIGSGSPRYSLGLFSFHSGIIHIPKELVDDDHPLQFKSFEHYGLLRYFYTLAKINEPTAKAYCGI